MMTSISIRFLFSISGLLGGSPESSRNFQYQKSAVQSELLLPPWNKGALYAALAKDSWTSTVPSSRYKDHRMMNRGGPRGCSVSVTALEVQAGMDCLHRYRWSATGGCGNSKSQQQQHNKKLFGISRGYMATFPFSSLLFISQRHVSYKCSTI